MRYDIEVKQHEDYTLNVYISDAFGIPLNLSGYSIKASIKKQYQDVASTLDFTITTPAPLSQGWAVMHIPSLSMATLDTEHDQYVYDLIITLANVTSYILDGYFIVKPGVTTP